MLVDRAPIRNPLSAERCGKLGLMRVQNALIAFTANAVSQNRTFSSEFSLIAALEEGLVDRDRVARTDQKRGIGQLDSPGLGPVRTPQHNFGA